MRRFGLIGHPLSHSFSKGYFEAKFLKEGIDAEYVNFDVSNIQDVAQVLQSDSTLVGVNVTIPYKTAIIQLLDDMDVEAMAIQAVNTVRIERVGKQPRLVGYNTDVIGFRESIAPLLQPNHTKALILGTGGAAKAALHVLTDLGLECLTVARDHESGDLTYAQLSLALVASHPVIINCTPVGMFPNIDVRPELPYGAIGHHHVLFDMVYNPMETLFLKSGLERGATVRNGLEMLHIQAEASWRIWNTEF